MQIVNFDAITSNLETPHPSWNRSSNPYDSEPDTPQAGSRVPLHLQQRVLDNLEALKAPTFGVGPEVMKYNNKISYSPRTSQFNMALQRMREGGALQKLREQRDADLAKKEESHNRPNVLSASSNPDEKGLSSPPRVTLRDERDAPLSALARSA